MCGIAGFITQGKERHSIDSLVVRMADSLGYRGPDSSGSWVDPEPGIALGHRRLAIQDLSAHGHQPMESASGRYVICLNGELYNFEKLRPELSASWRGHSDTEVMLAAIEAWGLEEALQRFDGMFAFALWDRQEKTLYLARDRAGERPLYYGQLGDYFAFASELKALHQLPTPPEEIDRTALTYYMRHAYVPAPYSIYTNVCKLEPGSYLQISQSGETPKIRRYWDYAAFFGENRKQHALSEIEATDRLEALLKESIQQQMISDVPLGAFLSGGVDSSTVTALMQSMASQPVKTFTIGFEEKSYNEAPFAKAVAEHLGTDHHEFYVSPKETQQVIPSLPYLYDEPFADTSQIPTYLVAKLAREQVTVSLSGDAGDELFGGYTRYLRGPGFWNTLKYLPLPARKILGFALLGMNKNLLNPLLRDADSAVSRFSNKLTNHYEKIAIQDREHFYLNLSSINDNAEKLVKGGHCPNPLSGYKKPHLSYEEWMMMMDVLTYLPGDILTKVDRAAMHVSLEARIPLLNKELIEFAASVPLSMKIRDGKGKWLLREVLYRYVPKELIERPKTGFCIPIGKWLKGPLRGWAESLLAEKDIERQGYLDVPLVRSMWQEHLSNRRDHTNRLWSILMFQSWLQTYHPKQFGA